MQREFHICGIFGELVVEFEFQFWQEKAGYIQQVTRAGTAVEWARGLGKIKIEDGKTTDLGDVVIGADKFK